MAVLLRKIEKKRHWDVAAERQATDNSLCVLDVPPELLRDVTDSGFSVYRMDDDKKNLGRIVAALSATRNNVGEFEYVLIPEDAIQRIASLDTTEGKTKDLEVNLWHRDVRNDTGWKAVFLAELMVPLERGRFLPKAVELLLNKSLDERWLKPEDLHMSIRGKFGAPLVCPECNGKGQLTCKRCAGKGSR